MTQQSFKEQCNIQTIINRAKIRGLPPPKSKGLFGDFTNIDFMSMQNSVANANQAFMTLAPSIRRRFNNDPSQLIEFIEDNENYEEAVKLGLIPQPAPKKEPVPVPTLDVTGTSDTEQGAL